MFPQERSPRTPESKVAQATRVYMMREAALRGIPAEVLDTPSMQIQVSPEITEQAQGLVDRARKMSLVERMRYVEGARKRLEVSLSGVNVPISGTPITAELIINELKGVLDLSNERSNRITEEQGFAA